MQEPASEPGTVEPFPGEATRALRACRSAAMRSVVDDVAAIASLSVPALITGETGVGKEVVARALHEGSPRRDEPFVAVNCAALPRELIEAELFGYERGAFTGAQSRRVGRFEAAGHGTVLLDELGDLPLDLQAKLLRVLQERVMVPLGGSREIPFRARILAATSVDVDVAVREGTLRSDLFYRLAVVRVRVPPLRARADDIPTLARALLRRYARVEGLPEPTVTPAVLSALSAHRWPGNIRELENALVSAAVRSPDGVIRAVSLESTRSPRPAERPGVLVARPTAPDDIESLEVYELRIIEAALEATGGNLSETARRLGIGRSTLRRKLARSAQEGAA